MINGRLIPFAVLALYALLTLSGQENPKQTNIAASKRCAKFITKLLCKPARCRLLKLYDFIIGGKKNKTIFRKLKNHSFFLKFFLLSKGF
jgi:hypothetical protein